MEKNVLNTDLTGKVAVVTGASGTLCSIFAKALARAGAKVALLGRNMEKLKELADAIEAEGGVARGYTCNVMNKANCLQVAEDVLADLGPCDILVNGAGGNNARANTDKEYFEMGDLDTDTVTFFDLDESGVEMVFNLNFIGTLLPTQAFARQMVGREGCNILNISSMNAYLPLTKIPAYSGSKAAVTNFTQWLAVHFSKVGIRVNAIAPGFFASEQNAKLLYNEDGTPTARTDKPLCNLQRQIDDRTTVCIDQNIHRLSSITHRKAFAVRRSAFLKCPPLFHSRVQAAPRSTSRLCRVRMLSPTAAMTAFFVCSSLSPRLR